MKQRGVLEIIALGDKCRIRMSQCQFATRELAQKKCNFIAFLENLYHQQSNIYCGRNLVFHILVVVRAAVEAE